MRRNVLIALISLLVLAPAGCRCDNTTHLTPTTIATSFTMKATDLYAAFAADFTPAANRYVGKLVTVTGTVIAVATNNTGSPYLILAGDQQMLYGVECAIVDLQNLVSVQPGMVVVVTGIVDKYRVNVMMTNCILIEKSGTPFPSQIIKIS